jgi:hypothetical protein
MSALILEPLLTINAHEDDSHEIETSRSGLAKGYVRATLRNRLNEFLLAFAKIFIA